jgi:lipopolysaccharide export system permease protein
MIKIIDGYIIKKYLGTFFFTLVVFTLIIVTFDVSERLDDFLVRKPTLHQIIFEYYAGFIPFYLNFLSPLINFIAVIFFTAKMADQTEIVPILTGLVSFKRFLRPYFIASSIIFVITLIFNLYIIPHTNKRKIAFENIYVFPKDNSSKSSIHMQLDKHTFVYINNFDNKQKIGYKFILEKFDGDELKQRLIANRIVWDSLKRMWSIQDYSVRDIHNLRESIKTGVRKDTILDMRPVDFEIHDNIYQAMSMSELNELIRKEKLRGTGALVGVELEKYKRYAYPLSTYVLTLMGVSLSSRKVRGGIGLHLGIGLFLSFTYLLFIQFTTMFALKGGLPPVVAVMIPNLLFGALGVYLLVKAPK